MRSQQDEQFSQFSLRIGDGIQPSLNGDFIQLPQSTVIPWESEQSIYPLIDAIFPNMVDHADDANYMVGRAIITPKNMDVDKINQMLNGLFSGEEKVYTSWDSVDDDNKNLYTGENVAPELGLCNGTQLICQNLAINFIDVEIMMGPHQGTNSVSTKFYISSHSYMHPRIGRTDGTMVYVEGTSTIESTYKAFQNENIESWLENYCGDEGNGFRKMDLTRKKTSLKEGEDVTKKSITQTRNIDDKTFCRKKVRNADEDDIGVVQNNI
ncbi:hypothetical protein BUALT_Bualt03G0170900 [Buddleja alternifolia]|uniref:ATP-dependent DNA helicase n=1 Tax=Buddleja alternifolia TaxID=168488 RepID=A0AAV6Y129_9LAMI|nr:hypothetical protein BUALT_Bualt03G0170900 [Buddleja alternifolia]